MLAIDFIKFNEKIKGRLKLYSIVLIAASVVLFIIEILVSRTIMIDGPYVYARYAQNVVDGYGFTWNRNASPAFGVTSIAYVYIVSFFKFLLPDTSSSGVLITASSIIGLITIPFIPFFIIRIIDKFDIKTIIITSLSIPYLIFFGSYTFHSVNGLETILSFAGNLFFIYSVFMAARKQDYRSILIASVAAFLIYFIRTDNAIYMLLFPYLVFYYLLEVNRNTVRLFYSYLLFFLFVDVVVKYFYFDMIVPLSLFVRLTGYAQKYLGSAEWNIVEYTRIFLWNALPFLIILLFTYKLSRKKMFLAFGIPLILTTLIYFFFTHSNGYQARYFFPSLPYIMVPAFLSLVKFIDEKEKIDYIKNKMYIILSFVFLMAVSAFFIEDYYIAKIQESANEYNLNTRDKIKLPLTSNWNAGLIFNAYLKQFPENIKIAAAEAGYIGAENPNMKIIDLTGLQDKPISVNQEVVEYLIKENPLIIWMPEWSNRGLNNELLMSKEFQDNFVFLPGAFNYGIAISRKNSTLTKRIIKDLRNLYRQN